MDDRRAGTFTVPTVDAKTMEIEPGIVLITISQLAPLMPFVYDYAMAKAMASAIKDILEKYPTLQVRSIQFIPLISQRVAERTYCPRTILAVFNPTVEASGLEKILEKIRVKALKEAVSILDSSFSYGGAKKKLNDAIANVKEG